MKKRFTEEQIIGFLEGHPAAGGQLRERGPKKALDDAFDRIWKRRILKRDVVGIHGLLFYELDIKKKYYPRRRDDDIPR